MSRNRKAAEDLIIAGVEEILPGAGNAELYREAFAQMDDEAFERFITSLENETQRLAIVAPNFTENKLSVQRNLEIGKKWGHKFFERVYVDSMDGKQRFLTNHEYLIIELPARRQAQVLVEKISIPKSTNAIDDLTGQPSGEAAGGRLSGPEVQVLAAQDLNHSLLEMLKYRGGDQKGFQAMNQAISETGDVNLEDLEAVSGEVEATVTLDSIFTSMHLSTTLRDK